MTAHIFEPVIKKAGFTAFTCKSNTNCWGCTDKRFKGRRNSCPVENYAQRNHWVAAMLGDEYIGAITLFDNMVRFRSSGVSNGDFKVGAKIGDINDPDTVDKIAKRLLKTAAKRVPIELLKSIKAMHGNTQQSEWGIERLERDLKDFVAYYDATMKGWNILLDKCEDMGLPEEPSTSGYIPLEVKKIKKPKDLQNFIKRIKKHQASLERINILFAEVLKREEK